MAQSTHDPLRGIQGSVQAGEGPGTLQGIPPINNPTKPEHQAKGIESGTKVCASVYSGGLGSCGKVVTPTDLAFAELSRNPSAKDYSALGNLPCGTELFLVYKGNRITAKKMDVGAGGKGCGGKMRAIDLSPGAAAALGFVSGLDVIEYYPANASKEFAESPLGKQKAKDTTERHCGHVQAGPVSFDIFPLAFCEAQEDIGKVFGFLTSAAGWARILKVLAGVVLLLFAIIALTKIGSGGEVNLPKRRLI